MGRPGGWSRSGATVIRAGVLIVIVAGILGIAIVRQGLPPAWWLVVAALGLLALGLLVAGAWMFGYEAASKSDAEPRSSDH
jgi:hypothetical protein